MKTAIPNSWARSRTSPTRGRLKNRYGQVRLFWRGAETQPHGQLGLESRHRRQVLVGGMLPRSGFDPRDGVPRMEELIQRNSSDDQPAVRESTKRATHTTLDEEVIIALCIRVAPSRTFTLLVICFQPDAAISLSTRYVIDVTDVNARRRSCAPASASIAIW
jgi:hypothetical protein